MVEKKIGKIYREISEIERIFSLKIDKLENEFQDIIENNIHKRNNILLFLAHKKNNEDKKIIEIISNY